MLFVIIILNLINVLQSQICSYDSEPSSISDCDRSHNSSNYCCFTELIYKEEKSNMCILFPKNVAFILPHIKQMDLSEDDEIDMNIDCGDISYQNNECGSKDPKSIDDCKFDTTSDMPCCLFKSPQSSVCFRNNVKTQSTEELFGFTIQCNSSYFGVKFIFIILFLFILI
jgi:hypothetical protein